jgi:hypothetical protein
MKSSPLGGNCAFEYFTPVQLEASKSVVSFTVNSHSTQYFSIRDKYSMDWGRINNLEYAVLSERAVVLDFGTPNVILVPATFASNKARITEYAKKLVSCLKYFNFVHFTHFGFLKSTFPKAQIKKILDVFFSVQKLDCEICWDIDEKFYEQMKELLQTYFAENDIHEQVENFDCASFTWNEALKLLRIARQAEQWSNEMANRQNNTIDVASLAPISTGAAGTAGTAGEFYALSLFIRNGFVAGKAPEGTALYDLFVMTPNAFSFAPVQVKTVTNGQHWMLGERHEEIVENLIFCFVHFSEELTKTRIFLMPASVVSHAIKTEHEIWMALPGRNGVAHRGGNMRTLKFDYSTLIRNFENPNEYLTRSQLRFISEHGMGWLDRYENNFDIFNNLLQN